MKKLFTIAATLVILISLGGCQYLPSIQAPEVTKPEVSKPALGELFVYFLDVGQGDSTLIDSGEYEILIDAGLSGADVDTLITPYIDKELDLIIETHPDADHIAGFGEVLENYEVLQVWTNGEKHTSQTYLNLVEDIETEGSIVKVVDTSFSTSVEDFTLYILSPPSGLPFSDKNNNSVVLYLQHGDIDFLFMGDAEEEAEEEMLKNPKLPDIEVLKVGHHGSSSSSSSTFLNRVKPEYAIYSAGEGNKYGHPTQEALDRLISSGATVLGTDKLGTILMVSDGNTVERR